MKYVHVSSVKRNDRTGIQLGGVPTFAWYLERAIPGLALYSYHDCPKWRQGASMTEWDRATWMAEWLVEDGLVDENTVVIGDGYWASAEYIGKVARLISVCHGSYYGRSIQMAINPWPDSIDPNEINAQLNLWLDDAVEIVSVGCHARDEIARAGIPFSKIAVIEIGVDLDELKPSRADKSLYLHVADYLLKGADIIGHLAGENSLIAHFSERTGRNSAKAERFALAKAALSFSRYEGNPYWLAEAMACGVPVIAHQVGEICCYDHRCGLLTDDFHAERFLLMIREFEESDPARFDPRDYANDHHDFAIFENEWRKYLEYPG